MSKSKFTIIFILVKKFILFISQSLYLRDKRKNHQKIVKDKESFQLSRFRQSKWTNLMSKGLDVKRFHSINDNDFWPSSC